MRDNMSAEKASRSPARLLHQSGEMVHAGSIPAHSIEINEMIDPEDEDQDFDLDPFGDEDGSVTYNPHALDEEEGCCFPGRCLMPGFHHRWECHDVEMVESYEREQSAEGS